MSKGTNYLLKFADFLDQKECKKEADYIDKLILFINKKEAEKRILLSKKSSFINNLIKLADKCDVCSSSHCADGLDQTILNEKNARVLYGKTTTGKNKSTFRRTF